MTIRDKMLKAYFKAAEDIVSDETRAGSAYLFHKTKTCAFFVEARRLNKE